MEGWRVLNKLANLRIDQNKSGTTAFHAGKFNEMVTPSFPVLC
ncbi:hypothetical protein CSC21_1681 [Escherichia coli]|nr:hypothetical protein CSC21_1681 [Escherichia coli]